MLRRHRIVEQLVQGYGYGNADHALHCWLLATHIEDALYWVACLCVVTILLSPWHLTKLRALRETCLRTGP